MRRGKTLVGIAALVGMTAVACSSKTNTGTYASTGATGGGSSSITAASALTADGSTFAQPLYVKWATGYASKGTQVSYSGTGSSQGISDLLHKVVDFAGTDAPYIPAATETHTDPILNIPTALGAVAVTYNLTGVSKLQLSAQTLADIFSGKIPAWNNAEVKADNPGVNLPSTPVSVVHRSDGSGTTFIFTSYLSTVSAGFKTAIGAGTIPTWPTTAQFKAGAKSTGVDQLVKTTPGAIGYVELTYALQNNTQTALIQNADKSAYLAPTVSNTASAASNFSASSLTGDNLIFNLLNEPGASSYPIAGPTYAILYQQQADGAKGKAVVNFLAWGLTTGQAEEAALDYVELPPDLATKAIAALKSVTYNGTALMGS
ncbi:MAG TPA: phosphate ABC transporter substrate-binding protein PstS [Actinomycetota bacterium]|nr:phosphate ABC transporter substrate-binding protein PstS [Actinomycetota bacterium]